MSWMIDRGEYLTTKLQYSNTHSAQWFIEGNLLNNTVLSDPAESARIISYSVNGYVPGNYSFLNYPAQGVDVVVREDGSFWARTGNDWTAPLVIDYVIQQGSSTLASQAVITSGKLAQTPGVLAPVQFVGNNENGISGRAWEDTQANKTLLAFSVKTADGETFDHEAGSAVELADGIEGYVAARDIANERVDDASQHLKVGDRIEAKFVGMDRKGRTLQLSIKAKDDAEMREVLEEYQSAAGGTTKLGALRREQLGNKSE